MTDCCGDGDILTIHPRINEVNRRVYRSNNNHNTSSHAACHLWVSFEYLHTLINYIRYSNCPAAGIRVGKIFLKILSQNQ